MTLKETDTCEYNQLMPPGAMVSMYSTTAFNTLNADKAKRVEYIVDSDSACGIVLGLKDDGLHAPFSAPFAGLASNDCGLASMFARELTAMATDMALHVTLPPPFYAPALVEAFAKGLTEAGAECVVDVNYHYPLEQFPEFETYAHRNARKNLRRAMSEDFTFAKTDDLETVYEVIRINRTSKGYYLAMTMQQVADTMKIIDADLFMLRHGDKDVASAVCFHVAPGIVQVIYWGDVPGFSEMRPMNLLAYRVIEHYHNKGIAILDIGPSSTGGVRNEGLCRFKESLGCVATDKLTFRYAKNASQTSANE